MADEVRIFGKRNCPYTRKALESFEKRGYEVEYLDAIEDPDMLVEMLEYSEGRREVPVILEGDEVKIGFGGT